MIAIGEQKAYRLDDTTSFANAIGVTAADLGLIRQHCPGNAAIPLYCTAGTLLRDAVEDAIQLSDRRGLPAVFKWSTDHIWLAAQRTCHNLTTGEVMRKAHDGAWLDLSRAAFHATMPSSLKPAIPAFSPGRELVGATKDIGGGLKHLFAGLKVLNPFSGW